MIFSLNTLASLLIASGEYNESSVRVALGYVNFDGVTGGHAWVEVYEDGACFPLDATMGHTTTKMQMKL